MECLNISKREKKCCHAAKKERKNGKVPGVLYGKELNNFLFEIGELELNSQIKKTGEHGVININVDGNEQKALIKEVQRDPMKHNIIHIDLEKLSGNESIQTQIPIVFEGEGAVKSKGGILQKERMAVKVQCKANNIPKSINVDLSKLNIGDMLRVGDLEVSEEITFVDHLNSVIISVTENNFVDENMDSLDEVVIEKEVEAE